MISPLPLANVIRLLVDSEPPRAPIVNGMLGVIFFSHILRPL